MTPLKFLLWWVFGWFFLLPLLTFIHEAGHGLMGLLLTKQPVTIQLGKLPDQFRFHWGRVTLLIRVPVNFTGFARVDNVNSMSPIRQILFFCGGPLASLGVLLISVWQALALRSSFALRFQPFWIILAAGSLIQTVFTLAPLVYPMWMGEYSGFKSDGYNILKLLFQQDTKPTK